MKTAELNNLTNSFQMVFSDLFKPFKLYNQVDLLVFNPPYVPTHDMEVKFKLNHFYYLLIFFLLLFKG